MFDDLKPYPEYMVGTQPNGWHRERLGAVARLLVSNVDKLKHQGEQPVRLCNYVDVYKNAVVTADLPFMAATATPDEVKRFGVRHGDVAITKDSESPTDIAVPALIGASAPDLVYGYHLAVLRPAEDRLHGAYMYLALTVPEIARHFHVAATGVTRFGLSHGDIKTASIPVPPLDEQRAIAKYLSHAHQRINKAITAKRRLIAVLAEMRRHAVEECFEAKTAGAPAVRLKYVATIQTGLTLGKNYGSAELEAYPYLRVANVQAGALALTKVSEVRVPRAEAERSTLRPGDLLVTEGGDIDKLGRGTIWSGEIDCCLHQNHVFAVRSSERLDSRYLEIFLQHSSARRYFHVTAKKTTNLASTNSTTLGNLRVPLPDRTSQNRIVAEFEAKTDALQRETDLARREIALLEHFRNRLTSDVVNGQIDVRHIAGSLPPIDPAEAFSASSGTVGDAADVADEDEPGDAEMEVA